MEEKAPIQEALPRYQSHKKVWAARIVYSLVKRDYGNGTAELKLADIETDAPLGNVIVSEDWISKRVPPDRHVRGGIYVLYEDGYSSWSPEGAFLNGYQRIDPQRLGGSGVSGGSLAKETDAGMPLVTELLIEQRNHLRSLANWASEWEERVNKLLPRWAREGGDESAED